jgi:hypothetical protein
MDEITQFFVSGSVLSVWKYDVVEGRAERGGW